MQDGCNGVPGWEIKTSEMLSFFNMESLTIHSSPTVVSSVSLLHKQAQCTFFFLFYDRCDSNLHC